MATTAKTEKTSKRVVRIPVRRRTVARREAAIASETKPATSVDNPLLALMNNPPSQEFLDTLEEGMLEYRRQVEETYRASLLPDN